MQTQDTIGWRMLLCSLILKIKPSESYLWKMCLGYSSFTLFLIFCSVIFLLHLQKRNIFILYTLRAIFLLCRRNKMFCHTLQVHEIKLNAYKVQERGCFSTKAWTGMFICFKEVILKQKIVNRYNISRAS